MSQSLSKIYIHLVFHVKSTSPRISEEDTQHLHAYIGTAINKLGCSTIIVGGTGDHVHALFVLSREVTISQTVKEIKRSSSMYLKSYTPATIISLCRMATPFSPSANRVLTMPQNISATKPPIMRRSILRMNTACY